MYLHASVKVCGNNVILKKLCNGKLPLNCYSHIPHLEPLFCYNTTCKQCLSFYLFYPTQGQTKVLVTGPWHANRGTYTVLLDGKATATTLVQNGVLRCFVPGKCRYSLCHKCL